MHGWKNVKSPRYVSHTYGRLYDILILLLTGKEYFVCDFKGHCVVVFNEEGQFLRRIGCESITNFPNGIDISDAGDVLVGDSHGNRFHVAVFSRDGSLLSEFECPYVKVTAVFMELVSYIRRLFMSNLYALLFLWCQAECANVSDSY